MNKIEDKIWYLFMWHIYNFHLAIFKSQSESESVCVAQELWVIIKQK